MTRLNTVCGAFGLAFGFLFSAAGFNQYDVIHQMLLLRYLDPFLVMASSMAVSVTLLWLMERRAWQTPLGGALRLNRWGYERKHVLGGVIFGAGWAITGACPGTVSAMIGAGSLLGIVTLAGVFAGIALRDVTVDWFAARGRSLPTVSAAEVDAAG